MSALGIVLQTSLGIALSHIAPSTDGELPRQQSQVTQFQTEEQVLEVRAPKVRVRINPLGYEFTGGVVARYGPTTVSADTLSLDSEGEVRRGTARGNVRVQDPYGELTAHLFEFEWGGEITKGVAEDVLLDFAGVRFIAREIRVLPERWELLDARGTNCVQKTPLFEVRSPRIVFNPGHNGQIRRPSLYVLGQKVITLPSQGFNLDRRNRGLRWPGIAYRREEGIGVAWDSGFLITPQSVLGASMMAFPNKRPSYSIEFAKTALPVEASDQLISPRTELAQRFEFGYFSNIEQASPLRERAFLGGMRRSLSIGSAWFQGAANQDAGDSFTKLVDVAYEESGFLAKSAWIGQTRVQAIRRELDRFHVRTASAGTFALPSIQLMRGVDLHSRFDGGLYAGEMFSGWGRAEAGLTWMPLNGVTLGVAGHGGFNGGKPLFEIDRLRSTSGMSTRIDALLGPTQVSIMWQYDRERGWFDRQYLVSQVVGCFQPFILYRQAAGVYTIGVKLRISQFQEAITSRRFVRQAKKPQPRRPGRP